MQSKAPRQQSGSGVGLRATAVRSAACSAMSRERRDQDHNRIRMATLACCGSAARRAAACSEVLMANFADLVAWLLQRVGEVIFSAHDEFARNQGWQISKGRFGLSRTVRHPGFDRLARCPECSGRGCSGQDDCDRCSGIGRITLGDRALSARR